MIDLDRALDIVRSVPVRARTETIPLGDALHRVLAAEVFSLIDSPPFDKSAMDGFAVGGLDDSPALRIVDTWPRERRRTAAWERGNARAS